MKAGKISDIKGIGVLKSMSLKNTFATYLIISILVLAILFFGLSYHIPRGSARCVAERLYRLRRTK